MKILLIIYQCGKITDGLGKFWEKFLIVISTIFFLFFWGGGGSGGPRRTKRIKINNLSIAVYC